MEEIGFCEDREGEAISQAIGELVYQQERAVDPTQLWGKIKEGLTAEGHFGEVNGAHSRELIADFMYVIDIFRPDAGPVAYAWPYVGFRRFPYYETIPEGAEDKVKGALKAVHGKPWRVTTRQMTPSHRTKNETLLAFIAK